MSGLPAITDVNVKLTGLASTYPDDLDLLLVGPGGQQATIVGAAGGSDDVTGVNLTLDDEAAAALPDGTTLTSGTYKPTNYDGVNVFPAPAPVATGLGAPLGLRRHDPQRRRGACTPTTTAATTSSRSTAGRWTSPGPTP